MRPKTAVAALLLLLLAVSFPLAIYAYYAGSQSLFSICEGVSSFAFWFSIVGLIFLFPMRYVATLYRNYIKTARGALIFVSYWIVHLFLYGLLLEGILAYGLNIHSLVNQFYVSLSSIPVYPVSATSILAGFGFNPALDMLIPPVYVVALSFYTIAVSFTIATLVLTNVMKVQEIGKMCNNALRSRTLVVLPALGVIGGAACCLSIPILISLAAPTSALFSGSPLVYYTAYLVFPAATVIGLKYNMDSTYKLGLKMKVVAEKNLMNNSVKTLQSTDTTSVGGS